MRRDIEIHINTGDVAINPQNKPKLREFRWVEQPSMLSRYIYGEIDVPYTVSERTIVNQGVFFVIHKGQNSLYTFLRSIYRHHLMTQMI